MYKTCLIYVHIYRVYYVFILIQTDTLQGRIQDFKLGGGAHLNKLRRAEGGANIFGVFRVKNHDFTPKKSYFFQFYGGGGGAGAPPPPPWIRPCIIYISYIYAWDKYINKCIRHKYQIILIYLRFNYIRFQ